MQAINDGQNSDSIARKLLGSNYISVDEIVIVSELPYDQHTILNLEATIPQKEVLLLCSIAEWMLIPGPPTPLSFSDMLQNGKMEFADDRWTEESFFNDEFAQPGWMIFREPELFGAERSYWKMLHKIELLLRQSYEVSMPTLAIDVAWCLYFYNKIRKRQFIEADWGNGSFPSISKIEKCRYWKGHGVRVGLRKSKIAFAPSGCGAI